MLYLQTPRKMFVGYWRLNECQHAETNKDKTELIILFIASEHQLKHLSDFHLTFDGTAITDVSCVKNLGMFFDRAKLFH